MPLVILAGWPLSGKTRFAHILKDALLPYFSDVEIVNDESLGIAQAATLVAEEKKNRAAFLAAVERAVSSKKLVIADGCNEIKGFRYQLYCISRAANTPHACIHTHCSEDDICKRLAGNQKYCSGSATIKDVIGRFEEPNGQSRWDSPLFHVSPSGSFDELDELRKVLQGCPLKQPSLATRKDLPDTPVSLVQALEEQSRRVLEQVSFNSSNSILSFSIDGMHVRLGRKLSGPELQRLKRQFIHLNRQTTCQTADIARLFIDYLNKYSNSGNVYDAC